MDLLMYIFLGFIQGFAEPIPISSSGHLLVFQKLVDSSKEINFELLATITNLGSLLAILVLFRKQIANLFKSFFGYIKTKENKYKDDYKYCLLIILATIPAGIMGIIVTKLELLDFLEENVKFVGVTLLITALFLFIIRNFKGTKDEKNISVKDAITVGLFQMVALVPGISRSGSTIVGGMLSDFKRETAFNFSFILYIPISIATTILGLKDLFGTNLDTITIIYYLISMFVAFIFTYVSTKWFKKIVKNGKLMYFVIYCLIVGSLILIFV